MNGLEIPALRLEKTTGGTPTLHEICTHCQPPAPRQSAAAV